MRTIRRQTIIPIYGAKLWLVCGSDYTELDAEMKRAFRWKPTRDAYGWCINNHKGDFGILLCSPDDEGLIAHEVFHLVHHILEWSGSNFDFDHQEQGAMLSAWLTSWVTDALKKPAKRRRKRRSGKKS